MPHRKEIGLFRKRGLDKAQEIHYNSQVNRGVAKFGIALGSGPRGRGFESRHSDHRKASKSQGFGAFSNFLGAFAYIFLR